MRKILVKPAEFRVSDGYRRWEQRTGPIMLGLSLAFVVVLVVPLLTHPRSPASIAFAVANVLIWVAFAVDYLALLYLANSRWRYVRTHPLDLVIVVVPFLRPVRAVRAFRLLRLLRLAAAAGVAHRRAQRSFHARVAAYVVITAATLMLLAAASEYDIERRVQGSNIKTIPDALWWALTTVTTVGYGDRYPTTASGRLVGAALMLVGIALLGVVTAAIAAWFVNQLRGVQEAELQTGATLGDVLEELRALRLRLDAIEAAPKAHRPNDANS
jgi:voltage-gated potassium channel